MTKICNKCGEAKSMEEFYKNAKSPDGKQNYCKECQAIDRLKNYHDNPEREKEKRSKEPYKNRVKLYQQVWQKKNESKECIKRLNKKFRGTEKFKEWKKNYLNLPHIKITNNLRRRISLAIKNIKGQKMAHTSELLGCSIEEFLKYLEERFQPGMSWNNYGIEGWHVDHIKPCILFDLTKKEEQFKCFHYTNSQPLWAFDNRSKHDKYIEEINE